MVLSVLWLFLVMVSVCGVLVSLNCSCLVIGVFLVLLLIEVMMICLFGVFLKIVGSCYCLFGV